MRIVLVGMAAFCLVLGFRFRQLTEVPEYVPHSLLPLPKNKHIIFLGRTLFFDPILSSDSTISCSSCHSPFNAFAHSDHALSHGFKDQIGFRNAPALFNLAWQPFFMWDGAINRLDIQSLAPIHNPKEMNSSLTAVLKRLRKLTTYQLLFKKAYGDTSITTDRFTDAIAQFECSLLSFRSKYDSVRLKKAQFNLQEKHGYLLYQANCSSCHTEPLFTSFKFINNGLAFDTVLKDSGRFLITGNENDKGKFKIPSLRNLSFSAPYMHDGRFSTLKQVLNHYMSFSDSTHQINDLKHLKKLSSDEKIDLIAFLMTLNDKNFIFNPNYSFPKTKR